MWWWNLVRLVQRPAAETCSALWCGSRRSSADIPLYLQPLPRRAADRSLDARISSASSAAAAQLDSSLSRCPRSRCLYSTWMSESHSNSTRSDFMSVNAASATAGDAALRSHSQLIRYRYPQRDAFCSTANTSITGRQHAACSILPLPRSSYEYDPQPHVG